jgi:hypothetical protein
MHRLNFQTVLTLAVRAIMLVFVGCVTDGEHVYGLTMQRGALMMYMCSS